MPAPDAGIGVHFGTAIGGVLGSGVHDEFTLIGDAVNVAQRLEQLCKPLNASIVVSGDLVAAADTESDAAWTQETNVELAGRTGRLSIAYLPRQSGENVGGGTAYQGGYT